MGRGCDEGGDVDEMNGMGLAETVERLSAAAAALESVVERMGQAVATAEEESVGRIVATVSSGREAELERRLAEAEQTIAELRTPGAGTGRKTMVAATMLAKGAEGAEARALDGALASLSIEQRIAVKAEMLRAGLLR